MDNHPKGTKRKRKFLDPDFQKNNQCIGVVSQDSSEDVKNDTTDLSIVKNEVKEDIISCDFSNAMTKDEINNTIQKCLEMSSENKITQKNAFALKLIDLMKFLLPKDDFSVFACTLEAGQKIYAYRVDGLHQQVVKLAAEMIHHHKTSKKNTDMNSNEKCDKLVQGKKKTKSVIGSSETFRRKLCSSDPKDKFVKVDGLPGAIMSSVKIDPNDLSLTLENNVPFWHNREKYKPLRINSSVTILKAGDISRKGESYESIKYIDISKILKQNKNKEDTLERVTATSGSNNLEDIIDDDCCDEILSNDMTDILVEQESDCKYKNDKKNLDIISLTIQQQLKKDGKVTTDMTPLETMKLLFNKNSDYHYLNMDYWVGPKNWKRSKIKDEKVKKNIKKKKTPREICYNDPLLKEKLKKYLKKIHPLKKRTVESWKKNAKRLTTSKDLKISAQEFLNLFLIPDTNELYDFESEKKLVDNIESDEESSENNYSEPMESEESMHSLDQCFYNPPENCLSPDTDPLNSAFYDKGLINQPNSDHLSNSLLKHTDESWIRKIIKIQFSNNDPPDTTMVPAPKIVKFQPIKYSSKPVQVDMKHLKQKMLETINSEIENSKCDDLKTIPEAKFRSVFQTLESNISEGMAFLALLTLANENNLHLENDNNDIKIKHESRT